jgi:hypothetical protein
MLARGTTAELLRITQHKRKGQETQFTTTSRHRTHKAGSQPSDLVLAVRCKAMQCIKMHDIKEFKPGGGCEGGRRAGWGHKLATEVARTGAGSVHADRGVHSLPRQTQTFADIHEDQMRVHIKSASSG